MRIRCVAFTSQGAGKAAVLCKRLEDYGQTVIGCSVKEYPGLSRISGTADYVAKHFQDSDAWIFVGACGIAVRMIAPLLTHKTKDPAVLVMDETGRYVIPLVGGHIGGANRLAISIAGWMGAVPVITTATDCRGVFAVDSWAVDQQLTILDPDRIRFVSGALLEGQPVGFYCAYPYEGVLPEGLETADKGSVGIAIGYDTPFEKTLHLIPREYVVGIGCRRGASYEAVAALVQKALEMKGIGKEQLICLSTLDRKKEEPALLRLAKEWQLPVRVWSAEKLQALSGDFTGSDFVKSTVGVDNVCERAAVAQGGRLLLRKLAENGVTVAVSHVNRSLKVYDTSGINQP